MGHVEQLIEFGRIRQLDRDHPRRVRVGVHRLRLFLQRDVHLDDYKVRILDGQLASPYARNLLASIESAYGRCAVEVLYKSAPRSNVIVSCFAVNITEPTRIYVDERNRADLDSARSP